MSLFVNFVTNSFSERKARAYSDEDIMLILPETISATDLKWLSIYCITYKHNFGEVFFPADVNVPPYMEIGEFLLTAVMLLSHPSYVNHLVCCIHSSVSLVRCNNHESYLQEKA